MKRRNNVSKAKINIVLDKIKNMTEDEKEKLIEMTEITIDYGLGATLSDESIAIYNHLTKER